MANVVTKRVSVDDTAAQEVMGSDELGGTAEYTILNADDTLTVELVEAPGDTWGSGFPLAPGTAWSAKLSPTTKLYVIAQTSTAVSVAVIGVQVP